MAAAACPTTRLLVGVPFTSADIGALDRAWRIWDVFPPVRDGAGAASTVGLLFLFNGRCTGSNVNSTSSDACQLVARRLERHGWAAHFAHVHLRGARLEGRSDEYDKRRSRATWTAGPNSMFNLLRVHARRLSYHHLLQLEPDVLPIRSGWLQRVGCIAATSDAWVIGSSLVANCSHDSRTGRCEQDLPERFAGHINGNAIYAVGDDAFAKYAKAIRHGATRHLPFDLALHVLREGLRQPERRQLMHRFQHSSFVLNMGTELPDVRGLQRSHKSTYLVHSSAFGRLSAGALRALFAARAGGADPASGNASSSHRTTTHSQEKRGRREVALDLAPLRRASSPGRSTVVAFVAGGGYADLCRNFVQHAEVAGIQYLLLVALDRTSLRALDREGREILDATHLVALPEGASDTFGSAAFFAANGARYRVLLEMLRAGYHPFVLDLDVVLLSDPLRWLAEQGSAVQRHELLVQSDARDGISQRESDPGLVTQRLGLQQGSSWTYANGGVFYCRSTPRTIALFERVWEALSNAERPPNEQDMLNRELAAGQGLSWALLPTQSFPNGFVYFRRPVPTSGKPVLVHANWIDGVREKVHNLREAGLWRSQMSPLPPRRPLQDRLLSLSTDCDLTGGGRCDLHSSFQSLRNALALAHVLNRTLVVPRFPLQRRSPRVLARTSSHFLDYSSFASHFPSHTARGPNDDSAVDTPLRVHLDVGLNDSPPPEAGFVSVGTPAATSAPPPLEELLAPFSARQEIQLSTALRRFATPPRSPNARREVARRLARGLKLAPRLMTVAHEAQATIERLHGEYDCFDASLSTEYATVLRGGAGLSNISQLAGAASRRLSGGKHLALVVGGPHSQSDWELVLRSIGRAAPIGAFVNHWLVTNYDTHDSNKTEALAGVETEVCTHARLVVGNFAAASTQEICRRRRWAAQRKGKRTRRGLRTLVLPCVDALGRELPHELDELLLG